MTPEQAEALTSVGRGTPMGELFRRYWLPIAATAELTSGAATSVRVLGEDLALFRTTNGELGLVDARCPHRGASLAEGFADDRALRCPYHGWAFDPCGACVDVSALANRERVMDQATTTAYPVAELGGLVFAYLGPVPAPALPRFDLFVADDALRDIGRAVVPCNWLQIMENSVDPVHLEWLHGRHLGQVRAANGQPAPGRYAREHVEIGFDEFEYGIVKRRVLEGGSRDDDDWAVGHPLVFPNMVRVGAHRQHRFQIRVPVDDTHTLHWWYSCYFPAPGATAVEQEHIPVYDVPFRDDDGFIVDFVDGGDIMTWVTQGAIADRTRELLVDTDRGIVLYRRMLLREADRVAHGLDPLGVVRGQDDQRDRTGAGVRQVRRRCGVPRRGARRDPRSLQPTARRDRRAPGRAGDVGRRVRVLCYAQHLTGVGHFVRMHTIAAALAARHDVYLVEGGRPFPRPVFDAEPARVPLPVLRRGADGELTGVDGELAGHLVAQRTDQLAAAVADLRPDVLLIDHYPFSKWELSDEIERAVTAAREVNADARIVCSLRDIAPRTCHEGVSTDSYADEVLRRLTTFDAIVVHADPRMTTLDRHFPAADRIAVPVRYTGLVVEPVGPVVGVPDPPYAIASAGGLDATAFLVTVIEAFTALVAAGAVPTIPLHVFAPANARADDVETVARSARGHDVDVHEFSGAFGTWVDGAALSISRGGYNTVAALLRSRVPAVVVPDPSVSDQRPRAETLARLGLATVVDDSGLPDPKALQTAIVDALESGRPDVGFDLDGATVTCELLERLVAGEQPWAPERAA